MKKRIKIGLGIIAIAIVMIFNVQTFSVASNHSTVDLSNLLRIALADAEGGGGIETDCLKLGNNFPDKDPTIAESFCPKSGKNETYYKCEEPGTGCTEVIFKQ